MQISFWTERRAKTSCSYFDNHYYLAKMKKLSFNQNDYHSALGDWSDRRQSKPETNVPTLCILSNTDLTLVHCKPAPKP